MGKEDTAALAFSPSAANLLANNANVRFSVSQLQAIARGHWDWKRGCIKRLMYGSNDKDLDYIEWDDGTYFTAANLKDFRQNFETALEFNHAVGFCYNNQTRKIRMLWIYRCGCTCGHKD